MTVSDNVMARLRVGVVGLGVMGAHHARIYASLDEAELVGVADHNASQLALAARRYKVPTFSDYRCMLLEAEPDAISIAVPTSLHCQVALEAMGMGIHVLVEKPIASTVNEAVELINRSQEHGVILATGHVERFNPAIQELKARLDRRELGEVFMISARRIGPFPHRVGDVGVVTDLAPHDLDIMRYVLDDEVVGLSAETARRVHATHEDLLAGLLRFRNGPVGKLDINWITPTKIREISITGERGMFRVDYLTQDFFLFENSHAADEANWDAMGILRGVAEGQMVRLPIQKREPLQMELAGFVAACRGRNGLIVSGRDATMALYLSELLLESSSAHEWLKADPVEDVIRAYALAQ